jgi:hypothetical protein
VTRGSWQLSTRTCYFKLLQIIHLLASGYIRLSSTSTNMGHGNSDKVRGSLCFSKFEQTSSKYLIALYNSRRARWILWRPFCVHWFQGVRVVVLAITTTSNSQHFSKAEAPHPGSRTPFDCCALSFQPFSHPVCARNADGTGFVFDLVNIIPWLKSVFILSVIPLKL